MSFDSTFTKWLNSALPEELPAGVRGFAINLTEVVSGEYAAEIIGAERFDLDDEDWACEEIWEPDERSIEIHGEWLGGGLGTNGGDGRQLPFEWYSERYLEERGWCRYWLCRWQPQDSLAP